MLSSYGIFRRKFVISKLDIFETAVKIFDSLSSFNEYMNSVCPYITYLVPFYIYSMFS